LNPRQLVAAQQKIAAACGTHIIQDVVTAIEQRGTRKGREVGDGDAGHAEVQEGEGSRDGGLKVVRYRAGEGGGGGVGEGEGEQDEGVGGDETNFRISLSGGRTVFAHKIVVAPGAYLNLSNILKNVVNGGVGGGGVVFDLALAGQTVAFVEVSAASADLLKEMPCIITSYASGELDGTYILPPVLYPDGLHYIKIGHHNKFERELKTKEEVEEWYRTGEGDPEAVKELALFLSQILPDIEQLNVFGGCCVTANTPDKAAPLVLKVCEGVVVAAGGCGYAAKSCDEIGRIAAQLL